MVSNVTDLTEIVERLRKSDLNVTSNVFGENIKAQTSYPQYAVYLNDKHLHDDPDELSKQIATVLPEVTIDGIKPVPFRRKGKVAIEVWVFVHFTI